MTGQGRPSHSQRSRAPASEPAVTPVVGAILILAITILGIAGVLYWGAPMIDRIQSRNAQVAVVGEFQDLRDASSVLSVPDHSRFPTIVIPRGELILEPGTRIMVTSNRDTDNRGCDFHVTDWSDTTAPTQVTITATGCRGGSRVDIHAVSGATLVAQTNTSAGNVYTNTMTGADFSEGDWLFQLTNLACPDDGVCAEAWLHSGDQVRWAFESATGLREVAFDSGAIFSTTEGTLFLEREPGLGDSVFGSDYYGLWLRSLNASDYSSISGAGSHQVYLSLLGNYDRVESTTAVRLRYDVAGELSEAWCNALLARNLEVTDGEYQSQVADCGTLSSTTTERSVCYVVTAAPAATDPCTSTPALADAFTFRFLHARIYTSLAV